MAYRTLSEDARNALKQFLNSEVAPNLPPPRSKTVENESGDAGLAISPAGTFELFSLDELDRQTGFTKGLSGEARQTLEFYLKRMRDKGPERRLAPAPDPGTILSLADRFPNFSLVVDEIAAAICLCRLAPGRQGAVRFTPLLLSGEPGIGKTAFCRELAARLGTSFYSFDMASMTTSFELGGMSLGWANGRPGRIFQWLFESETANPLILLDEIDKVSPYAKHDPLGALYSLLESESARKFSDEAIPVPIDASHILWVMTANDPSALPKAIRSRVLDFKIDSPSQDQAAAVVASVYRKLRDSTPAGRMFPETLDHGLVKELTTRTPREAKRALERALANSARRGSTHLSIADLPIAVRQDRPPIGFV